MFLRTVALSIILAQASALAEPLVTAAAQLAPRAADPSLVGYISASGAYSDARSCDYPQTVSTSGSYVQCCPTTGACPFYTSCSGNTLFAASATVPCDVNAALTCNTASILSTAGAAGGGQYLACWQKTLGSSPFTIVQNIPSASVAASTTGTGSSATVSGSSTSRVSAASSGSSSSASSRATQNSSSGTSASASTARASSASASANIGSGADAGLGGSIAGALAIVAQMLL